MPGPGGHGGMPGGHHGGPMGGPGGYHRGPMGGPPPPPRHHHYGWGGYRRPPYHSGCLGSFLALILGCGGLFTLAIIAISNIF